MILKENLIWALRVAIKTQSEYEKEELNYRGDSALVAGWKDSLEELKNNSLTIKY